MALEDRTNAANSNDNGKGDALTKRVTTLVVCGRRNCFGQISACLELFLHHLVNSLICLQTCNIIFLFDHQTNLFEVLANIELFFCMAG